MCVLTESREASLQTSNVGISLGPIVVTDSAPGLLVAHLHTTFERCVSIDQSDTATLTHCSTERDTAMIYKLF